MKTLCCLVIYFFCITFTATGQENSTWYSFGMGGDKTKITELKDFILYQQVVEEESPYPARIDTVRIAERLNDSTYILNKKSKQGDFAIMASTWPQDGAVKSIGIYYPSQTAEAAKSRYLKEGLPVWGALTTRWVFSDKKANELELAPGYDEVTREAVLEAFSVREEISPAIKAYAKEHPDTKPFRFYRFVELKGQHKFIELGYNPYKPVSYNFEKQFEGDEEVIKALTETISFDD
jgi:hypothetical protein